MSETQIIRGPDKIVGDLTPAELVSLEEHNKMWMARAARTAPIVLSEVEDDIKGMYRVAGLAEPKIAVVRSPVQLAIGYAILSHACYLRQEKQAADMDAAVAAGTGLPDDPTQEGSKFGRTDREVFDVCCQILGVRPAYTAPTKELTNESRVVEHLSNIFGLDVGVSLDCGQNWWRAYQGGNMWAAYPAYISFTRDHLGLRLPEFKDYQYWENAAINSHFRVVGKDFCLLSDFPAQLHYDDRNRPHSFTEPSHEWRDGTKLYHIHGVRVPPFVVEAPETITIQMINAESNTEVRRVMVEVYGYDRYVKGAKLKLVDSCPIDHPIVGLRDAKLWYDRATEDTLLDVLNSTPEPDGSVKRYVIPVDASAYGGRAGRECLAATASTWRRSEKDPTLEYATPEDYKLVAES